MFPPLVLALPRVVPPGGDTIDGRYIPEGVSLPSQELLSTQILMPELDYCLYEPLRGKHVDHEL